MKKIFLALLCGSTLTLVACDKASQQSGSNTTPISYSQNNKADIQQDLIELQKFTDQKSEQGIEFQDRMIASAQKLDKNLSDEAMKEVENYFEEYNKGLDALSLKSKEVDERRQLLKQNNQITVQLSQEAIAAQPEQEKLEQLQQQLIQLQQQLDDNRKNLDKKLSETKP